MLSFGRIHRVKSCLIPDLISPLLHTLKNPQKFREILSQSRSILGIEKPLKLGSLNEFQKNKSLCKETVRHFSVLFHLSHPTDYTIMPRNVLFSPYLVFFLKATSSCLPHQKYLLLHCVCPGLPFLASLLPSDNTHELHLFWWQNTLQKNNLIKIKANKCQDVHITVHINVFEHTTLSFLFPYQSLFLSYFLFHSYKILERKKNCVGFFFVVCFIFGFSFKESLCPYCTQTHIYNIIKSRTNIKVIILISFRCCSCVVSPLFPC